MALVVANYSANQSNTQVIPAVTDRLILVTRFQFFGNYEGYCKLISDPTGSPVDLTPPLYFPYYGSIVLELGRAWGLTTGRGKGLGFSSVMALSPKNHSILVWYEVVA